MGRFSSSGEQSPAQARQREGESKEPRVSWQVWIKPRAAVCLSSAAVLGRRTFVPVEPRGKSPALVRRKKAWRRIRNPTRRSWVGFLRLVNKDPLKLGSWKGEFREFWFLEGWKIVGFPSLAFEQTATVQIEDLKHRQVWAAPGAAMPSGICCRAEAFGLPASYRQGAEVLLGSPAPAARGAKSKAGQSQRTPHHLNPAGRPADCERIGAEAPERVLISIRGPPGGL